MRDVSRLEIGLQDEELDGDVLDNARDFGLRQAGHACFLALCLVAGLDLQLSLNILGVTLCVQDEVRLEITGAPEGVGLQLLKLVYVELDEFRL